MSSPVHLSIDAHLGGTNSATPSMIRIQSDHGLEAAVAQFRSILQEKDARDFERMKVEDVYKTAEILEREQEQLASMRNLRRIEPLLAALKDLGAVIDLLVPGTSISSYLWAPMNLLLQVASEDDQCFKDLLNAYSQLAKALPSYPTISDHYAGHNIARRIMSDLFLDMLDFHRQTYTLLRRSGWKQIFAALWKNFSPHFDSILQRINHGHELLQKVASTCHSLSSPVSQSGHYQTSSNIYGITNIAGHAVVHQGNVYTTNITNNVIPASLHVTDESLELERNLRFRLIDDLEKHEVDRQARQLRESLLWLSLDNHDVEQERMFSRRADCREDKTCEWILANGTFLKWLDRDQTRKFLWLKGKPGSGKTTLATFVAEHAQFPLESTVLYFLCFQSQVSSPTDPCCLMLSALIAQVLRKHQNLVPYVHEDYVKKAELPSLRTLTDVLRVLLSALPSTYIVLDGLDECEPDAQKTCLNKLDILLAIQDSHRSNDSIARVLVCSRDTKATPQRLRKEPTILLSKESDHMSRDIKLYTLKHLSILRERFPDAYVDEIVTDIVKKADGMFLWVKLVVGVLIDQESLDDLQDAVRSLPSGLKGLYKTILHRLQQRADEKQKAYIHRAFTWISFSSRPLTSYELCDALVLSDPIRVLSKETKLSKGVLDLCKPLLEVQCDETVTFVHFSVKEFLLDTASGPYLQRTSALSQILAACLRYLLSCGDFFLGSKLPDTHRQIVLGFHCLFQYIHENWDRHLAAYADTLPEVSRTFVFYQVSSALNRLHAKDLLNFLTASAREGFNNLAPTQVEDVQLHMSSHNDCERKIARYITDAMEELCKRISPDDEQLQQPHQYVSSIETAYSHFRALLESLLTGLPPFSLLSMGVTDIELATFRSQYATEAYVCTFRGCPRTQKGFDNALARATHVERHLNQICCAEADCDRAKIPFSTRQALKRHILKYHTTQKATELPKLNLSRPTTTVKNLYPDGAPQPGLMTSSNARLQAQDRSDRQNAVVKKLVEKPSVMIPPAPTSSSIFSSLELTAEDNRWINTRAAEMAKSTPRVQMVAIVENMDSRVLRSLAEKKIDPIIYHFRMKATKEIRLIQAQQVQIFPMHLQQIQAGNDSTIVDSSSSVPTQHLDLATPPSEHLDSPGDIGSGRNTASMPLDSELDMTRPWPEGALFPDFELAPSHFKSPIAGDSGLDTPFEPDVPSWTSTTVRSVTERNDKSFKEGWSTVTKIDKVLMKLYKLRENDWYDLGTGLCTVRQGFNDNYEIVVQIIVESEDQPGKCLLDVIVRSDDGYQKQQDTLIVWTTPNGVDMAMSFREAADCDDVWSNICSVQESHRAR